MDDLFRIFPDLPRPDMANRLFVDRARQVKRNLAQIVLSRAQHNIMRSRPLGQPPRNQNDEALRRIRDIANLHYERLSAGQQKFSIGRALRTIGEIAEASIRSTR